jgi:hypothetical protein
VPVHYLWPSMLFSDRAAAFAGVSAYGPFVRCAMPHPATRPTFRLLRGIAGALLVAATLGSRVALGQADRVDAGSFSVMEKGVRIGREQFSIRRAPSPDGTAFELRAESVVGERRFAVQQSVDSAGSPVHYSLEIREGTTVAVRAGGQRVRGRFATQARRQSGESAREYMIAAGVIILEPGFYHQIAVVLRGRQAVEGQAVEMTVLSVLDNSQQQQRLTLEARDDQVIIGGVRTAARRWRLESGSALVRTVWGDAEGRVLKVSIPAQSLEAVRDDLPKEF